MISLMARGPNKYNDLQLACAVATCKTMQEVLLQLGLAPYGGNYENVRQRIRHLGLDASHLRCFQQRRRLSECTDNEISEAVRSSRSLASVMTKLGFRPGSGTQASLKARIAHLGLDTSHLLGQGWRRGRRGHIVPLRPLEDLLVKGILVQSNRLKRRLICEGLKEPRCESCGTIEWNGAPIPLELDHINGRRDDNRLENLRVLCPNCHAQTDTYRGRNIGVAALS
jgi:hypothetical protein